MATIVSWFPRVALKDCQIEGIAFLYVARIIILEDPHKMFNLSKDFMFYPLQNQILIKVD